MDPSMNQLPDLEELSLCYKQVVLLAVPRMCDAQAILGIGETKLTLDKRKYNLLGPLPEPIVLPQDLSIEKLLEIVPILRARRAMPLDPFIAYRLARADQLQRLQQNPPPPPNPPLPKGPIVW
jgi:hypothetical protein